MSVKERNSNRAMLIASGNVVPTATKLSQNIRHIDMNESRAAAIAARRSEMHKPVNVTAKKERS